MGRELTTASSGTREVIGTLQVQVVTTLSQQTEASLKQLASVAADAVVSQQDALKRDVLEGMLGKMANRRAPIRTATEHAAQHGCRSRSRPRR